MTDHAVDGQLGSQRGSRPKGLGLERKETLTGYFCISPWLLGMAAFFVVPMLYSLWLSLTHYSGLGAPRFAGLANYTRMLQNELFWTSISNTLIYSLMFVAPSVIGSLLCAMLLNQQIRGRTFFRSVFFLPSITPVVAAMFLWMWILQPKVGLFNYLLSIVGVDGPGWLGSTRWSKPALAMISLWGAMQGVPNEYIEAAEIDGASAWRKFISITVPIISPIVLFNTLIAGITALQMFEIAYIASAPQGQQHELGGPGRSTLSYVLNLYIRTFQDFDMGYGSALAWFFFAVVLLLTFLFMRSSRGWVFYESAEAHD